ncbi:IQ domain-containing protein H-like [Babylonia areolata]|uniref:IQ domain-containing protein H-like n=1 Tax=Babylonia areolata TaxID=304850 RepID=UPI003FD2A0BB
MVPLPPIPPGAPKSSPRASNVVKTVEARVPIGLPPVQRSAMATAAATTEEEVGSATDSFVMEQGRVCETRPDFVAFKQRHAHDWGRIVPILRQLEKLLTKYAVPCATILGDRGPGREALAALKIQTAYRRHRDQANYQQYRRLKRTVRVIEEFWGRMQQRARIRQRLQQTVAAQLERFRERAKVFAESWEQIRTSKRVVIHVPSLGYRQDVREKVMHFGVRQNTQMARLCEINDPNVDVIYVSPVPLSEETLQYYNRLLGLAGAVESGRVEDQCDLSHRYKVLVPEAVTAFQPNWMSLSTLLKYSPRTLTRIATLIRGRVAYMVTGLPHPDDAAVSDALDVPVLCPEPQVAGHCSSKSGARGLFQAAGIRVPPGEGDILRLEQLHESLTQLVLDNLNVRLWLLKLNEELDGRGIARCEVTAHLTCFPWLQEEAERYGHNWAHRWAQEKAFNKVLAEIPGILQKWAIPTDAYKSWDLFLLTFLSQGGIIEAFPPTPDVTVLTANFLLEPGGAMKLLMAGDQIHSESPPLRNWGLSLPQCSLEPMVLNNMGRRLARVCRALGVVGYLKVDLVTFVDPQMLDTVVWALDLHLGYSDSLALFRFAGYLTLGQFHARNHTFTMPVRGTEHPRRPVHEGGKTRYGYCVMSSQLVHSNLALLQLPVFFRLCRAYGIGFDVQEKNGTLFTLIDSINRDQIGMITIGESLKNALATFARQLCKIHEEVSTPKMQGISNFKGALQDIESILSLIQQNIDKHTEQENRQQVQEE